MHRRLGEELVASWDRVAKRATGEVSINLRSLGGTMARRRDDAPHYAASTIKLAVAIASTATQLQRQLDPHRELVVRATFPSAAGGAFTMRQDDDQDDLTWQSLGRGLPVSLLRERMVVESSNIATNVIVQDVGLDAIRDVLASAGASDIKINRLIGDEPAETSGVTNVVTANALSKLLESLASGRLLPMNETEGLLQLSARQAYRQLIPAGLPHGTWVAGKAGWNDQVKHEVALIRPMHAPPYILCVCTTTSLGQDAEPLVARLSAVTWEHWMSWHALARAQLRR